MNMSTKGSKVEGVECVVTVQSEESFFQLLPLEMPISLVFCEASGLRLRDA